MVALSELLVLISIAFGFLLKHNSENKILMRYHIVWLLATREAMQDFPSNTKRRKEWEDACGQIKLPKVLLFIYLFIFGKSRLVTRRNRRQLVSVSLILVHRSVV